MQPVPYPYIDDFSDEELYVLSTIGQGPKGEKGDSVNPTQEQVKVALDAIVEEHPEYVTTVEDHSISTIKLTDNAVTRNKIADGAVTHDKLDENAVPTMSASTKGIAKVGAGLTMNGDALELDISGDITAAVQSWLEAHPEVTTTVQDNSLTDAKLIQRGGILQREQWLESLVPVIKGITKETPEADVHSVTDSVGGGLLGIEVYGRSVQDLTPTPDAPVPIRSVMPNLYRQTAYVAGATRTTAGLALTYNEDGTVTVDGTATNNAWLWGGGNSADERYYVTLPAGTYTACGSHYVVGQKMVNGVVSTIFNSTQGSYTFTLTEETQVKIVAVVTNGTTVDHAIAWAALYEGSETYPYMPYGTIELHVVDGTNESVIIPIDLQGHVLRSLPDGTHDEVVADEWGHMVLTQRVGETNQAVTDDVSGTVGIDVMSSTGVIENDAQVIYKLPTPIVTDLGYLNPVMLPASDFTAYVVPTAPSMLRYGFDVAAAIAEIA